MDRVLSLVIALLHILIIHIVHLHIIIFMVNQLTVHTYIYKTHLRQVCFGSLGTFICSMRSERTIVITVYVEYYFKWYIKKCSIKWIIIRQFIWSECSQGDKIFIGFKSYFKTKLNFNDFHCNQKIMAKQIGHQWVQTIYGYWIIPGFCH